MIPLHGDTSGGDSGRKMSPARWMSRYMTTPAIAGIICVIDNSHVAREQVWEAGSCHGNLTA